MQPSLYTYFFHCLWPGNAKCTFAPNPFSIYERNIIDPETRSYGSDKSTPIARRNTQHQMCRFCIGIAPTDNLYRNILTFTVRRISRAIGKFKCHFGSKKWFSAYISIINGNAETVLPLGNRFTELMVTRSYTSGIHITVLIFPALYQI